MKKIFFCLVLTILSITTSIQAQKKQPLFVLDLAASKYFKTLFSPYQFNIFEDKLFAFNDDAQWAVYNYSTKKESIDNTFAIKGKSYDFFNILFKNTNERVIANIRRIYFMDKNKLTSSLKFNVNIEHVVLLNGKYALVVLPILTPIRDDSGGSSIELIVYDGSKRLYSKKDVIGYVSTSFRDSKNVLSMVTDSPEGLTEYRYDTLTNTLVKSFYLYDENESYLAYSNEKYVYCFEDDFTKLSVKKRKAQNERLENVMTIPLKDYFPNLKANPFDFTEGEPNFRMVEIKGKLHLVYLFNKKLYCYLLDVPN
ncbi:hypothetical protein [Arcicella rosea]|uniref:YD repeat-containing protein n=1 Tax=Arcicella rosea TaxID=502909 RepID=A0A841EEL1_9BACT|nr:hypothetical protein [Arcicella rosea]MBB6001426.1 hypothetical protein [Arcicella rosea]